MTIFLLYMRALSDVTLAIMIVLFIAMAIDARRARNKNGLVVKRFSQFFTCLAIFFSYFTLVYIDRRCPECIPYVNMVEMMGYEWYWPFRLMLIIAGFQFWMAMRWRR